VEHLLDHCCHFSLVSDIAATAILYSRRRPVLLLQNDRILVDVAPNTGRLRCEGFGRCQTRPTCTSNECNFVQRQVHNSFLLSRC
jgi:hypothetical protein